jgi:hypothetical protein
MRWILALAASSMVLVASAIEPPKNAPAPAKPPAKEEPATPAPSDAPPAEPAGGRAAGDADKPAADAGQTPGTPSQDDDEQLPPLPPDTVPSGPPPQRFTPSEKVRADFPVSFPIDI